MYAYGAYPPPPPPQQQESPTSRAAQAYQRALPSPDLLMSTAHYNPNALVSRRAFIAANQGLFGLGINGNQLLPPNFNAGQFGVTISSNITDRSISNAYNLDRDGINVDLRRYRPAYYAARWHRNNPGAIYPNYYPYRPYAAGEYIY